jgi:hypothetical protein
LIEQADLIFYICAAPSEIELLNESMMRIGRNIYHHEFNRLHFVPKYKAKCFHVTFSKHVQPFDLKKQLLHGYFLLEKTNRIVGKNVTDKANEVKCLKLHEQTTELLDIILNCSSKSEEDSFFMEKEINSTSVISRVKKLKSSFLNKLVKWLALNFLIVRFKFMFWPNMHSLFSSQELIDFNDQPLILEGNDEFIMDVYSFEPEKEQKNYLDLKCGEAEKLLESQKKSSS